jgi:hypothetical protein
MIVTGPEIFPFKTKFRLIKGLFKISFAIYIYFVYFKARLF